MKARNPGGGKAVPVPPVPQFGFGVASNDPERQRIFEHQRAIEQLVGRPTHRGALCRTAGPIGVHVDEPLNSPERFSRFGSSSANVHGVSVSRVR
jgi:hypothetical protein